MRQLNESLHDYVIVRELYSLLCLFSSWLCSKESSLAMNKAREYDE